MPIIEPNVLVSPPWIRRLPGPVPLAPILTESIYVCSIGHAFGQFPTELLPPGSEPVYFVSDFLVDQSQSTGGGAFLADPIQFDLTQSTGYMFSILAPSGRNFHITLPDNVSSVYYSAYLGRQEINGTSGVFMPTASTGPNWDNFTGLTAPYPPFPAITYNNFSITQANNSAIILEAEGKIDQSVQFTGINFLANFSRAVDPGAKWYNPLSYAVPSGTKDIYPKSETFVSFGYQTIDSHDPGRFVTLAEPVPLGR
jgi:hypothetical protein